MSLQIPKLLGLYKIIQPIEYTLETGSCSIGRSMMCQVVVPLKTVSSLHAKLERDGPHYVLYDANSANGTFVNGRQIREPYRLVNQDLIGLSADSAMLRFEDPDSTLQVFYVRLSSDDTQMTVKGKITDEATRPYCLQ